MELDPASIKPSITRLKRAQGQLSAVIRMLEEGQDCHATVTQLAAVSKAIDKASYSIIATGMKQCMTEHGPEAMDMEKLEKLFLSFS